MNVWLCYQMYKNNFLNTFLTPFVDSRWFFSTFWRWRSIFQFDVLLKSTQRWECELLQEHVHAQTHAPETFQNLDKYDYRWQEDFTWYAGCCSAVLLLCAHTQQNWELSNSGTLFFFVFFFKFSLNGLRRTKWHLLPLPNHTCLTTKQETTHTANLNTRYLSAGVF